MKGGSLQQKKEENIKNDFKKLNSANKFTKEYIYQILSEKYFLLPSTIERICWGKYDARRSRKAAASEPQSRTQAQALAA